MATRSAPKLRRKTSQLGDDLKAAIDELADSSNPTESRRALARLAKVHQRLTTFETEWREILFVFYQKSL